ncbi:MAG TPA: AAA family ATPase [Nitrososphaeraceae archaeon]|jgi:cell division control protein 6|nr:AAA family ATPase [Nitrososphaeraceae archaeon]
MPESTIFLDRSKLSPRYVPTELPHREKEIERIYHTFRDSFNSPERFPLTIMQIVGPAGIGKTSTVLATMRLLDDQFEKNRLKMKVAYVNLKLQGGNKYAIYRFILEKIAPELPAQGLSAEEMLRFLLRYLIENKIFAFIVLDEIDYLIKITKDSGIIYDLTRLNEFDPESPCHVKGVIFVARSTEFYSKLDQAELSSLGRVPIRFPMYSLKQVGDILSKRCSEAFRHRMVGSDLIDKVSEITVSSDVKGDIRYSLELLLYAGNLAESNNAGAVSLEHILKVHSQIHPSLTLDQIRELSKNQLVTLLAVTIAMRVRDKNYVDIREIRSHAIAICEDLKIRKLEVEDYLDDLRTKNIIEIRSLKEIGIHSVSVDELQAVLRRQIKNYPLNGVSKRN